MKNSNFTEKRETAARRIDEAGFAAYRAVGTDDFLPAFTKLLEVFKKEYAAYLYAEACIDPFDDALADENYKKQDKLEEISFCFAAGLDVLNISLVERFDPMRATGKLKFFDFLCWNVKQRADSDMKKEAVADYRSGICGMTRREERLLSAALQRLSSVAEITAEKLREVAEVLGTDYETLCKIMVQNNASSAESLDSLFEDSDGETSSLYDRVAARDDSAELRRRAEETEKMLGILDALLSCSRDEGVKKKDAPQYLLSRTEKERYPIVFTNSLILGWVDELRDSSPECKNREDVFKLCFSQLALSARFKAYKRHLAISPDVFELYINERREFTAKELGLRLGFDSTSLPGIADSVAKKLQLFIKK